MVMMAVFLLSGCATGDDGASSPSIEGDEDEAGELQPVAVTEADDRRRALCDAYDETAALLAADEPDLERLAVLARELDAASADDVGEALAAQLIVLDQVVQGDRSGLAGDQFALAATITEQRLFESCPADERHAVTAEQDRCEGIPERLDAGMVSFLLENEGERRRGLALSRIADADDRTVEDLTGALPDEAGRALELVGTTSAGPDGAAYLRVATTAGRYLVTCPVTEASPGAAATLPPAAATEITVT
jgi:hypothetical protein